MKTLLELSSEAAVNVDTLKCPNISEWVERINPILEALGEGYISDNVHVDELFVDNDGIRVVTSYVIMSCADSDIMFVPMHIIEAEDPVKSAKLLTLNRKLERMKQEVSMYKSDIASLARLIIESEQKIKELTSD